MPRTKTVDEAEQTDTEQTDAPENATENQEEPKKGKRFEPPEGFTTPSGFVHVLKRERSVEVKPQQLYGYCKNNNAWKEVTTTEPTYHFPIDKGLDLWDAMQERKAARAAETKTETKTEGSEE